MIGKTSRWSEESDWIVAYDNAEFSEQACSQDGSLFQWCSGWVLIIARRMVTSRAPIQRYKIENDSHLAKPSYDSSSGFSGVSLRRKRGKNGVIPSLSRSCKALASPSKGQSERPPDLKPTRIDMLFLMCERFCTGPNVLVLFCTKSALAEP